MSSREKYQPGPAAGAEVRKDGEMWTLILVRDLRHPPAKVWRALTEPEHLRQWAPFDADRNLGSVGTAMLSWVGAPQPFETRVKRAEEPRLLEYVAGPNDMRWELEPLGEGTRLKLWTSIDRRFVAMGAAGWHVCLDVLDLLIGGDAIGRIVGPDAMQFSGWQRLHAEYAQQFGVEMPSWSPKP
jgi:uncharacterized protein YndB with AHSA1/START domain